LARASQCIEHERLSVSHELQKLPISDAYLPYAYTTQIAS